VSLVLAATATDRLPSRAPPVNGGHVGTHSAEEKRQLVSRPVGVADEAHQRGGGEELGYLSDLVEGG
jgi:hypothetical protein